MLKDSSTYCPDIFHNLYIEPVNKDSVNVAACCQAQSHVALLESFSFVSDSNLMRLRESSTKSIRSPECNKCWRTEELGGRSRRHSVIDEYRDFTPGQTLTSLDINVTWACNLACVMCGPQWSSAWAKEIGARKDDLKKLGRQDQKNNSWLDRIDFSQVQRVHFNGGEPLLNNSHKSVMQRMLSEGSLSRAAISYNTNGTQFPDQQTLDLWSRARLVKVYFSIDAIGDAFEYVRYPASWKAVEQNILKLKSVAPGNVMFGFNVTVGCYNILEFRSVWRWFCDNLATNREGDASDFCWQPSNGFDPRWIIEDVKCQVIDTLRDRETFGSLIAYLENTQIHESDAWMNKLDTIDNRRKLNWRVALKIGKYYQ